MGLVLSCAAGIGLYVKLELVHVQMESCRITKTVLTENHSFMDVVDTSEVFGFRLLKLGSGTCIFIHVSASHRGRSGVIHDFGKDGGGVVPSKIF